MSADDVSEVEARRAKYASQFDVPDGGRYANDWASRIDAVLSALDSMREERDDYRLWNRA